MSSLPGGTVTFLFSDVEGSTRLLRALGDDWAGALADYRRILRETFAAEGGREVDTQGDGMFFVFPRARPAVAAAAEAQRRIQAHAWPEGGLVRVRMGLHTGEPAVGEEGYVGMDVVRAARIAAAAHGGQVLLSATTHSLVAADPVEGVGTIFLGEQSLKDLPGPVPMYQLVIAGLQTRFEVLRSQEGAPAEPVQIAGREPELAREIEGVVRDLRTSIEQRVADSLRGIEPRQHRRSAWPFVLPAFLVLLVVAVPVVWLLTR
ncbi:MAG TPA: adenylate/guanylate cyclase domain-containing protein [Gaiellaceae bacterium]|nr:adenylate/guanylate cyclase domain-containing protein [Gaiellaceae bacterium]